MFVSLVVLAALSVERPGPRAVALAAVAAVFAVITRNVGVALCAGLVTWLILDRRYRSAAIVSLASLVVISGWAVYTLMIPGSADTTQYVDVIVQGSPDAVGLSQYLTRLAGRMYRIATSALPHTLSFPTVPGTIVDNVVWLVVSGVGLAVGFVVLFFKWRIATLYGVIYLSVFAVWPFAMARLLEPVIPILVPAMIIGAGTVARRWNRKAHGVTVVSLAVLLVLASAGRISARFSDRARCPEVRRSVAGACGSRDYADFWNGVEAVSRLTPGDAVVLSPKESVVFYYSGRRGAGNRRLRGLPTEVLMDSLRNAGATHVLLSGHYSTRRSTVANVLRTQCEDLTVEAAFPPYTYLLALSKPPEEGGAETAACDALREFRGSEAMQAGAGLEQEEP